MTNKLNNKTAINKVKPIQTQIVDAEKKKGDKVFKEGKFFISSNEYDTILDSDTTVHVVDAMMGKGKAQKLDSLVLSENGYIQMREVKIGTKVYGEDGELHKVIGVYPQGEKEVYRVIFSDGTFTECCKEHLWTYQTPQDKLNRKYRTEELSEIIKKPLYKETNRGDKNWQFFIPITKPINFKCNNKLPIHPYILGVLLGDGGLFDSITLTNNEKDIIEKVSSLLDNKFYLSKKNSKYRADSYIIKDKDRNHLNKNRFKEEIKQLGLLNKLSYFKFIPDIYKYASVSDRVQLLQGLIDTDGNMTNSAYEFSTTAKNLCEDIKFVIQSLGGTVHTTERITHYTYKGIKKQGHISYRLYIKVPSDIKIYSSKKHEECHKKPNTSPYRNIKEISYIGKYECQCILVDNPTHLYLTNDFIVTHNTQSAIKFINEVSNEYHFIYITPFLTEVKRIKDSCIFKKFIEPSNSNKDGSKITDFKELLTKGKNIVTTHALFSSFNEEIIDIAKLNNYILIMDEVSDVVSPLNITKQDLKNILDKFAHIDNDTKQLIWDDSNYSGKFNEYRDMAKIGTIYVYNDIAFLWTFPVSIFKAFNKVFILTYKFSGQIQSFYYNYFKVNYDYIHIIEKENETEYDKKYQFEDKLYDIPQINNSINYKELLNIYCGKLNDIGEKVIYQSETERRTPLSSSWYDRDKDGIYCKILSNNTYNYFQNIINSKSQDNMWTTFQDYKPKIKAKGFSKGFVSCNSRATNDYADKNSLAYLVNRYLNPIVKNFFDNNGIKVDEEEYALSEMLQWIFRSRIRKGEQINIYVPSLRMRELLENWLEEITPIKEEV